MQQGIVTKSRSKPRNVLLGITPTQDTFTTPPSNLSNITDGNPDTTTGTGTKTLSGGAVVGQLFLDVGSTKKIILTMKADIWSSANHVTGWVDFSTDGNTYKSNGLPIIDSNYNTQENSIKTSLAQYVQSRYIRIRFYAHGACDASVKIYDISGYEVD